MSGILKQDVVIHGKTEEEKLMLAKAYDCYLFSEKKNMACFTGFLTPADRIIAEKAFKGENAVFYGGYEEAERCVLSFGVYDKTEFPICVIKSEGDFQSLSHRDFLGSLTGLGITRENIGDIIKKQECCYIFVLRKMAEYIAGNLIAIGKSRCTNMICECEDIVVEKEFESIKKSVASLRADAVIAAMFNLSRTDAAEYIKRGLVFLNYRVLESCDKRVSEKDVLSFRGKGKAEIEKCSDLSKKGRIFIEIKKYK